MNKLKNISFFLISLALLMGSCKGKDQSATTSRAEHVAIQKPVNVFPFYKSIEIKPGYHFEVVSWGKGIDTLGGYLILMSDSLKNNYKSISAERKGIITDAWNMDLDNDGNPELYIQYVVRKNVSDLNVYEFAGNSFDKISFPGLSTKLKKDFQGNDQFFVKNGELFRKVPIVATDSGKTTTVIKTLKYSLRGNSFNATEVETN